MLNIAMVIGGLLLLFFGGEWLVKGSVSLAKKLGLSSLMVSAVVIGFGTSMPEMTVSIGASLKGAPDIAIGNIIGSNIANSILIIGVGALLAPIIIQAYLVRRDMLMMLASSIILCALALWGMVNFWAGLAMFSLLVFYIIYSYHHDKNLQNEQANEDEEYEDAIHMPLIKAVFYSLLGLTLLIFGAHILVEGGVAIARLFGVSEAIIGLSIVAIGTSLPELVTAIIAAYHKHSDVIIGNILGSNIFNILSILGVTSMITTIPIAPEIKAFDIWVMLAVTLWLALYLWRGMVIGRISGIMMLCAYGAYMIWLYANGIF
jgi:cation:H+ antiporter